MTAHSKSGNGNSNFSLMNHSKRCEYLKKNWSYISQSVKDILSTESNLSKTEISGILPARFSKNIILGEGMWGVVLKLSNPKIVAKVTSDLLELSLIDVILKSKDADGDTDLSSDKGIPHIAGLRLFNDLNGIFVREDLDVEGITLSSSNPISRCVNTLIKNYVTPLSTDEMVLSELIHDRADTSLRDVAFAHSILKGNALKYSRSTLSKMPSVSPRSKSYNVVNFIKNILKHHSIGLIDLHSQNLARLKHDISDVFGIIREDSDYDQYVISDLGLAYDTPIMAIDSPVFDNFTNLPALRRKQPLGVVLDRMISLYLSRSDTVINTIYNNILTKEYMVRKQTTEVRKNPYTPDDTTQMYLTEKLSSMAEACIVQGKDFLNASEFYRSVYILAQRIIEEFEFDVDIDRFANSIFQEFIMYLCNRLNLDSDEMLSADKIVCIGLCSLEDIQYALSNNKSMIRTYIGSELIKKVWGHEFNIFKDVPAGSALVVFTVTPSFHSFERLASLISQTLDLDLNAELVLYLPTSSISSVNGL